MDHGSWLRGVGLAPGSGGPPPGPGPSPGGKVGEEGSKRLCMSLRMGATSSHTNLSQVVELGGDELDEFYSAESQMFCNEVIRNLQQKFVFLNRQGLS